jgi:hypothetical protein
VGGRKEATFAIWNERFGVYKGLKGKLKGEERNTMHSAISLGAGGQGEGELTHGISKCDRKTHH